MTHVPNNEHSFILCDLICFSRGCWLTGRVSGSECTHQKFAWQDFAWANSYLCTEPWNNSCRVGLSFSYVSCLAKFWWFSKSPVGCLWGKVLLYNEPWLHWLTGFSVEGTSSHETVCSTAIVGKATITVQGSDSVLNGGVTSASWKVMMASAKGSITRTLNADALSSICDIKF